MFVFAEKDYRGFGASCGVAYNMTVLWRNSYLGTLWPLQCKDVAFNGDNFLDLFLNVCHINLQIRTKSLMQPAVGL